MWNDDEDDNAADHDDADARLAMHFLRKNRAREDRYRKRIGKWLFRRITVVVDFVDCFCTVDVDVRSCRLVY